MTYELCKAIRHRILTRAAEVMNYTSWDHEFATNEIRTIPAKILNDEAFEPIHLEELTAEQMDDLGFGVWSEENPMRLIPLWLLPFLPEEVNCGCIDGEIGKLKKSEMDNDHRFGCLAYGVMPAGLGVDHDKKTALKGALKEVVAAVVECEEARDTAERRLIRLKEQEVSLRRLVAS